MSKPPDPFSLTFGLMPWMADAACRSEHPSDFYAERGGGSDNHCTSGKRVCAQCPVLWECLEQSCVTHEMYGIWGGAGEALRRSFIRAMKARDHGPEPVADCDCQWCHIGRRHLEYLDSLDGGQDGRPPVMNLNLPTATHGRRSTYARGCRCEPCLWSAGKVAQMLSRFGADVPGIWTAAVGELTGDEARFAADVAALRWLTQPAVLVVPEVWAWVEKALSGHGSYRRNARRLALAALADEPGDLAA